MTYQLKTDGVNSDRFVLLVEDGVLIEDLTNPGNPVTTALDWIQSGYADGAALTGLDSGLQNNFPSLTVSITDPTGQSFATIWQGGVAKTCNKLPFIIRSVSPTVPYFIANCPRVRGSYRGLVVFTKPTGESAIIDEFSITVS